MSKIFRSRWSALLWAAGILWTAYDVAEASAPSKPTATATAKTGDSAPIDADTVGISNEDLAVLKNFVDGS